MYQNKATLNTTATANGGSSFTRIYWSSTEVDQNSAWLQYFGNGDQYDIDKHCAYIVRAVRAF
jgi:hypothetical protein